MTDKPTRPIMRYHGGKWRLAPWIIDHLPEHRIYVEPFGGVASVLLRKDPSYAEVYNDIDDQVVNVFRVLRDPEKAQELERKCRLTPFARSEFDLSYEEAEDEVERARRILFRSFAGFGSTASSKDHRTGFRANNHRSGSTPTHDWHYWPDQIQRYVDRLRNVTIENKDALEVIRQHDAEHTLFYVDPPYVAASRREGSSDWNDAYRHELDRSDHEDLAQVLRETKGMVVISGYPSELYGEELYADWHRIERSALADGARERTEVIWMNEAAIENQPQKTLFDPT